MLVHGSRGLVLVHHHQRLCSVLLANRDQQAAAGTQLLNQRCRHLQTQVLRCVRSTLTFSVCMESDIKALHNILQTVQRSTAIDACQSGQLRRRTCAYHVCNPHLGGCCANMNHIIRGMLLAALLAVALEQCQELLLSGLWNAKLNVEHAYGCASVTEQSPCSDDAKSPWSAHLNQLQPPCVHELGCPWDALQAAAGLLQQLRDVLDTNNPVHSRTYSALAQA